MDASSSGSQVCRYVYLVCTIPLDSISYSPPGIVLNFVRVFPHFSKKKALFGAGCPLVWHILNDYSPYCR